MSEILTVGKLVFPALAVEERLDVVYAEFVEKRILVRNCPGCGLSHSVSQYVGGVTCCAFSGKYIYLIPPENTFMRGRFNRFSIYTGGKYIVGLCGTDGAPFTTEVADRIRPAFPEDAQPYVLNNEYITYKTPGGYDKNNFISAIMELLDGFEVVPGVALQLF